jgi:hypothetical protein
MTISIPNNKPKVSPRTNLVITSIKSLGAKKPDFNQEEPSEFIIEANTPPNRTVRQLITPVSFEFMRFCKIDAYPKDTGVISWRTVLFGGVFASIINSLGSSWLKSGFFAPSDLMEVITRFVLGDTLGLLFGMLIVMLICRRIRQLAQL